MARSDRARWRPAVRRKPRPGLSMQALVVYLYAPAEGPHAGECLSGLRSLWTSMAGRLGVPPEQADPVVEGGREPLARAHCAHRSVRQLALWRRHDVLCMGVLLAPRAEHADVPGETDWAALEKAWEALCPGVPYLLGESRVLMALRRAGSRSGSGWRARSVRPFGARPRRAGGRGPRSCRRGSTCGRRPRPTTTGARSAGWSSPARPGTRAS